MGNDSGFIYNKSKEEMTYILHLHPCPPLTIKHAKPLEKKVSANAEEYSSSYWSDPFSQSQKYSFTHLPSKEGKMGNLQFQSEFKHAGAGAIPLIQHSGAYLEEPQNDYQQFDDCLSYKSGSSYNYHRSQPQRITIMGLDQVDFDEVKMFTIANPQGIRILDSEKCTKPGDIRILITKDQNVHYVSEARFNKLLKIYNKKIQQCRLVGQCPFTSCGQSTKVKEFSPVKMCLRCKDYFEQLWCCKKSSHLYCCECEAEENMNLKLQDELPDLFPEQ